MDTGNLLFDFRRCGSGEQRTAHAPHCLYEHRSSGDRDGNRGEQGSRQDNRRRFGQRRPPWLGRPPVNFQGRRSTSWRWLFNSGATQLVASELALLRLLGRKRRHASLQMLLDRQPDRGTLEQSTSDPGRSDQAGPSPRSLSGASPLRIGPTRSRSSP